jgi:hypothetical protein
MSENWGTLTDYATGAAVRPATAQEWRRTADKLASRQSDSYTGAWDEDGQAVWVDGGPDAEVSREDMRQLRDEAGSAGDSEQVALCNAALGETDEDEQHQPDPDAAWIECASVILDTRMRVADDA